MLCDRRSLAQSRDFVKWVWENSSLLRKTCKPMAEQSVIVWDLETVPDLAAAARMLDLGNAPEAEVREALGPGS